MAEKNSDELATKFGEPVHDDETIRRRREEAREAKEHRRRKRYMVATTVAGGLAVYLFLGGGLRTIGLKAEHLHNQLQHEPTCSGTKQVLNPKTQPLEAAERAYIETPTGFDNYDKIRVIVRRLIPIGGGEFTGAELVNPENVRRGDLLTLPRHCEN